MSTLVTLPASSMHSFAASTDGSCTLRNFSMLGGSPATFLTAFGGTIDGATCAFGGAAGEGAGATGVVICFGAGGAVIGAGAGDAGFGGAAEPGPGVGDGV